MKKLIAVVENVIGAEKVNSVNARELHKALEIKKDFSNWIKAQIEGLWLEENVDYMVFTQKGENLSGGRPSKEYILALDAAKHIAMASRTKRGKEIRDYFIEVEKRYKEETQIVINNTTDKEKLGALEQQLYMLKRENTELKRAVNRLTYNSGVFGKSTSKTNTGFEVSKVMELIEKGLMYDELHRKYRDLSTYAYGLADSLEYGEIMMGWAKKLKNAIDTKGL